MEADQIDGKEKNICPLNSQNTKINYEISFYLCVFNEMKLLVSRSFKVNTVDH